MFPFQLSQFSNRRRLRYRPTILPLLALLTLWFCLNTRPAAAATIPVNGTTCTLSDAINAANNDTASGGCLAGSGADTITLRSDVTLSRVDNDANGLGSTGLPAIRSVITVEGGGHTIYRPAWSPAFRLFYVATNGTLTLNRITLTGGNTTQYGGGIFNNGTLVMSNSTLTGNTAYNGGGIFNIGTLVVSNSTLTANTANSGGGIYNFAGMLTVSNSTLTGNTANSGGGIYNFAGGMLTLNRSLLAGNHGIGAEVYKDSRGTVNANNDNLIGYNGNAGTVGFTPGASDIVPTVGLAQILNSTLTDNGGGTPTHALVSGSPAIDAAGDSGLDSDQRSITRPQGVADDIGAFELVQTPPPPPSPTPTRVRPTPTPTRTAPLVNSSTVANNEQAATTEATPVAVGTPEMLDNNTNVTPSQDKTQELFLEVTTLPDMTSGEATPVTDEEQAEQTKPLFLPLVVAGQENLLAQDEPVNGDDEAVLGPQQALSLSANLPYRAYLPLVPQ